MKIPCLPRLVLLAGLIGFSTLAIAQIDKSDFAIPASDEGLPGEGPVRNEDWFQRFWQDRRFAWAKSAEQDHGAVVFLGDSITQGWGGGLGAAFPGMKVANRGISGDTTRGVLIRLEEDVLTLDPAAVVILIGTNDLDVGVSPEMVARNMKLILSALKEHDAAMPVILCEVFPSDASKNRPTEQIRRINELYLEQVKGDAQVVYVETFDLFNDGKGNAIPAEFPDLLHPNEIGYAKWAAGLRPLFETMGLMPVDEDFVLEDGFEYLFNGYDLTGWGYRVTPQQDRDSAAGWQKSDPKGAALWPFVEEPVSFDGLTESRDGRFAALNGRLVSRTPKDHRLVRKLETTREFGRDFVLKMEFRATPMADSGVYVRGPQLQCRDYLLAGPYRKLQHYRPQDWNELVITVKDGAAHCVCNGEVLEEAMPVPDVGPIGVEGDMGQMEYRRIRIREF